MTPRLSLSSLVLLSALALTAGAQQAGPTIRRVSKPLRTVSLDLASGTLSRGVAVRGPDAAFSTCVSVFNNDFSGFVGTDSGLSGRDAACEWIDAADKGFGRSGGKSGYLSGFQFSYCSSALDTSLGGPGGTTRIGFRTAYEEGNAANANGPSGVLSGTFLMSGLPAHTSNSGFFGGFSCYLLEVDIGDVPVCLPDGPIGWSWRFLDIDTFGLAQTFPFLACAMSCSGPNKDGMGMRDGIDRYCPGGSAGVSFSFSTGVPYFTSLAIELREAQTVLASSLVCNGSAVNPVILSNTSLGAGAPANAPILGEPWRVTLDCNPLGSVGGLAIFRLSRAPKPAPVLTGLGEVLVGTGETFLSVVPASRVVSSPALSVPKSLGLYSTSFLVQALCPAAPRGYLSNALLETVGSE